MNMYLFSAGLYFNSGQTTIHLVWESDPNQTKYHMLILSLHKQDN